MQVQTVAQRAALHVLGACGWAEPSDAGGAPPPRGLDADTAAFVHEFAGKKARRLANTDSDAEHSDVDPCQ